MSDKLISYLLLTVAAIAAALMIADVKGYFKKVQNPIASLTSSSGTVKKLSKDEIGWEQAVKGTKFAEGDSISVGEDGSAVLEFTNGSSIELNEGSLMVLSTKAEKVELNFSSGRAKLRLAQAEQEKLFKISQTNTPVSDVTPEPQKPVVVEIVPAKPKPAAAPVLPKSKKAETVAMEVKKPLPNPPLLKYPKGGATIYIDEKSELEFNWEANNLLPIARYVLVLTSTDGTRVERESTSPEVKIGLLPEGVYTWSVLAVSRDGTQSAFSSKLALELKATRAPKLLAPKLQAPARKVASVTTAGVVAKPAVSSLQKPKLLAPKPVLLPPRRARSTPPQF